MQRNIKGAMRLLKARLSHIKQRMTGKDFYAGLEGSPKDALAALYTEIQSSAYFDEAWYHLAYQGEMEFPDDPLHDYVWAGIPKGRDPSPYFNTTLYRREHPVPPYLALRHFLQSGRTTDSGAYRNEQALLSAQKAFMEKTETALIQDRRSSTRQFAVFLQNGVQSVWANWQPAQDQSWHLLINHYDPTHVGNIPCDVEFRQAGSLPGTKFTAFYTLLEKYAELLEPYAYVLLLDDDVEFDTGDISRLFALIHQQGWEMAQASLSADSCCSFQVLFNPGKDGWRRLNGVELMMPVYSVRILDTVRQLMAQSISGWGFDSALSMVASRQGFQAVVVDDIIARHLKPTNADTGPYYQMLHRNQIYPEIEFTHLQKKYGFTTPLFYEI